MNFIYDILLNYNDLLYDFFDWNMNDKITHIRKIPLFKVSADIFSKVKNNKVKLDMNFLENIYNKTEIFKNHKVEKLEYAFLISDGLDTFSVVLDKNGNSIKYSSLLLDENDEVLEVCERLEEKNIKFKIIKKHDQKIYFTRKDVDMINYIRKELKTIKDDEKAKYIYYELFDKKSDDIKYIKEEFKKVIKNIDDKFYLKIYNLLKL